jgi:hypothetical protein
LPLFPVRASPYPYDMSEEEDVIISCTVCGATADYDTPCPNGCDPLAHYLVEEPQINIAEKDFDALSSISLNQVIELVNKWLEEEEGD